MKPETPIDMLMYFMEIIDHDASNESIDVRIDASARFWELAKGNSESIGNRSMYELRKLCGIIVSIERDSEILPLEVRRELIDMNYLLLLAKQL
jgi:hypothetical protein